MLGDALYVPLGPAQAGLDLTPSGALCPFGDRRGDWLELGEGGKQAGSDLPTLPKWCLGRAPSHLTLPEPFAGPAGGGWPQRLLGGRDGYGDMPGPPYFQPSRRTLSLELPQMAGQVSSLEAL